MKIRKLTKKQAKELIKLAKRFFPEYNKIEITPLFIGHDFYNGVQSLSTINFWTNWNGENGEAFESDSLESVDWYQFCVLILPIRIRTHLKDNIKEIEELLEIKSLGYCELIRSVHLLDYLVKTVKYMDNHKFFK
jgi:hypothetical protein